MSKVNRRRKDEPTFSAISAINVDRDIRSEITNKLPTLEDAVDLIEKQNGISSKNSSAKVATRYKSKILSPDRSVDAAKLEELFNSPKHQIVYYKDNWSSIGEYKVYVIYTEQIENSKTDGNEQTS